VLTRGLLTFAYFAGDAYVPLTLTSVRHTSTTYAGLTLTLATLTWTAAAWLQSRVVNRVGPRVLVATGLSFVLAGLAGLAAVVSPSVPLWVAPAAWAVSGFGIGLAYAPISLTALGWAARGREGEASAALQLSDVLGTALGTGIAGAAIALVHQRGGHPDVGLRIAFAIAGSVAIAGLVVAPRVPAQTARSDPP
jgi:MFS family permease